VLFQAYRDKYAFLYLPPIAGRSAQNQPRTAGYSYLPGEPPNLRQSWHTGFPTYLRSIWEVPGSPYQYHGQLFVKPGGRMQQLVESFLFRIADFRFKILEANLQLLSHLLNLKSDLNSSHVFL